MSVLQSYEPKKVMHYFEELTKIPRGSGNEKAVSDYLKKFAEDRNLFVVQDDVMNILIKKPGAPGYENSVPVIIQGHMDMVDEKNNDTVHDFTKDPLKLRIEGEHLYATGTTLGADNGIAVAYALAILDGEDLPHPPLEVLITVEEETGMLGAASVNGTLFEGKMLINIDSEEEGTFLVSCAGGARQTVKLPLTYEEATGSVYKLSISGLRGGHSGIDIPKERGNSNVLLGRALYLLSKKYEFVLSNLHGGSKNNAIPREAEALLLVKGNEEHLADAVSEIETLLAKEIETQDSGLNLKIEKSDASGAFYTPETTAKAIGLLFTLPNGVISMSQDIQGLVETSLNLGVLHEKDNHLYFDFAVRSSVGSRKEMVLQKVNAIGEVFGAVSEITSSYPEWQYAKESNLRDTFIKVYEDKYGKKPQIEAIHAGLECGILAGRIPGLDMISLGPNLYDVHTPDEHMDLVSVKNVYEFLLDVLKELK